MSTSDEAKEIEDSLSRLRETFQSGTTRSYEWRRKQLLQLQILLKENESVICEALSKDLGRSVFESSALELIPLNAEIDHTLANLKSWMASENTSLPVFLVPAVSEIRYEPFGICLIISAFNYPVELSLGPLIGAIAAGNCAVIKPSEIAPATEALLKVLIEKYLDNSSLQVVCGEVNTTTILLQQQWDKIFFTGSPRVGKIVSLAAAQNLTPVTLELGGKSPVLIDRSVTDIDLCARRVLWGKFANAGQTCIAPDYILCHESLYDAFLQSCKKTLHTFYGENPEKSSDYGRIVSKAHCQRLKSMIEQDGAGSVFIGGQCNLEDKYVAPTILTNVMEGSSLMQDEIFGPLLPVLKYNNIQDALSVIRKREKPLALYIFSKDKQMIDTVITNIQSGGVVINDVMMHFANSFAPFGGIGNSGVGGYHGWYSFECFSHKRSILRREWFLDVPLRYPPSSAFALNFFKFVFKVPALPSRKVLKWASFGALGTAFAYYYFRVY